MPTVEMAALGRERRRATAPPPLHGFLVIDKPAGWTSFDVVARARRLLGVRKIGHAGTLDPAATGVLPLAVGHATRVLEYLAIADKTYRAEVTFGVETDSHDRDGRITAVHDPAGLTRERIEAALAGFRGEIAQIPPMHAAIKVDGRRLYELARRGEEIEREPRPVTIHRLELLDWQPPVATLLIDCSKGTYIRALARDLGTATGTGAYLSNLIRTRTGPFTLAEAITLDDLAAADLPAVWSELSVRPDAVLADWPARTLDAAETQAWLNGRPVARAQTSDDAAASRVRVYDAAGAWIGIGEVDDTGQWWRPVKVVKHEE